MGPFALSFEQPHHGWLPLRIEAAGKVVAFEASDVPNNPVEALCDTLFLVARGDPATVWCHLEPDGYYLHFEPEASNTVLRLTFAPNSVRTMEKEVLTVTAATSHVLLVVWRFLRRFESAAFTEPHWPPTKLQGMKEFGQRLKSEI